MSLNGANGANRIPGNTQLRQSMRQAASSHNSASPIASSSSGSAGAQQANSPDARTLERLRRIVHGDPGSLTCEAGDLIDAGKGARKFKKFFDAALRGKVGDRVQDLETLQLFFLGEKPVLIGSQYREYAKLLEEAGFSIEDDGKNFHAFNPKEVTKAVKANSDIFDPEDIDQDPRQIVRKYFGTVNVEDLRAAVAKGEDTLALMLDKHVRVGVLLGYPRDASEAHYSFMAKAVELRSILRDLDIQDLYEDPSLLTALPGLKGKQFSSGTNRDKSKAIRAVSLITDMCEAKIQSIENMQHLSLPGLVWVPYVIQEATLEKANSIRQAFHYTEIMPRNKNTYVGLAYEESKGKLPKLQELKRVSESILVKLTT